MRFALAVAFLVSLTGCPRTKVEVDGKLVEVTPDALVVEVKTKPGLRVDFGMSLQKDRGVPVSADGTARLSYPRAKWQYYSGNALEIAAAKHSFGHETYGSTKVETPALIASYLRIEKDEDTGLWFGALRFDKKRSEELAFDFGEDKFAARISRGAKKLPLLAAIPPGAELVIAGKSFEGESNGLVEAEIPMRELVLDTTLAKATTKIPVVVKKDDDSAKFAIELTASTTLTSGYLTELVAAEIEAVEKGTLFPARPSVIEAVLVKGDDGAIFQLGKPGPVGDVHFVAIEKATRREGASCVYNTFSKTIQYDDTDVRILDARTGKEVAKKKFMAPYTSCPQMAASDESFTFWAGREKLDEWITKTALGASSK